MPVREFIIAQEDAGLRLDAALARLLPDSSRTFLQRLIREQRVACDGEPVTRPRFQLRRGMKVTISLPEHAAPAPPAPEEFRFPVIYEDETMLVINKPAGVVVHPAAGNPSGTVVNALLSRYPSLAEAGAADGRPGIVHRLDKDTSGCLVIAKTPESQFRLGKIFAARLASKCYLALVRGVPPRRTGEITTLIGRHPVNRQKMAVVERNGKIAVTSYELLGSGNAAGVAISLLRVRIATGRTHQIRVHMSHLGFPVLGDRVYGGSGSGIEGVDRQMLHAWKLKLPHPVTGIPCAFKAEIPDDFKKILTFLPPSTVSGLN